MLDRRAIARGDELDRVFRQAIGGKGRTHRADDRHRGFEAFLPAAQDARVARLQAQPAGIGGHVEPRFVDDADDADGHGHTADQQTVRPRPARLNRTDGIGQTGDVLQALGDGFDALGIEARAIDHRGRVAVVHREGDVARIGGEDRIGRGAQLVGGGAQSGVLDLGRRLGQCCSGFARAFAHREHRRFKVQVGRIRGGGFGGCHDSYPATLRRRAGGGKSPAHGRIGLKIVIVPALPPSRDHRGG